MTETAGSGSLDNIPPPFFFSPAKKNHSPHCGGGENAPG